MSECAVPLCPNCGYDLERHGPITIGNASIHPDGTFILNGESIRLGPTLFIVAQTLMAASPRVVSKMVLRERMGYDGFHNLEHVYIARLRNVFRSRGITPPVVSLRNFGWKWVEL